MNEKQSDQQLCMRMDVLFSRTGYHASITPDVPLQPVKGNLIERAPHGKEAPTGTWQAPCIAVMLSRDKVRARVLLLGKSQRVSDALERVGVGGSWPIDTFTGSTRMQIKIA